MFETSVVTLDGIGHFFIPEFPEPPFIFGPCFKAGWEAGWQPAVYEKDDNKVFNRLRLPASWRLLLMFCVSDIWPVSGIHTRKSLYFKKNKRKKKKDALSIQWALWDC